MAARILIFGGGYVGMYTALGLQKQLSRGAAEITVVEPQSNMTYQPFLPGGGGRQRRTAPRRRAAAQGAAQMQRDHRRDHQDRRTPTKTATIMPIEGEAYELEYDILVVCPGSISRLLPDPRAGRARHRLQDHRRGHLPAQPRALAPRPGGIVRRSGAPQARADVRLRRRRLRRGRGAGRARGHGALRAALLPAARAERHALDAGRGGQPDHARGVGAVVGLHGRPAARAQHRRPARHPARVGGRRPHQALGRRGVRRPRRWCGRPE